MMVRGVTIHGNHTSGKFGLVEVPTSGPATGSLFCSHNLPGGVGLLTVIHIILYDIVEAYHIESFDEFHTAGIGHRTGTGGVEKAGIFPHRFSHTGPLNGILQSPFLIAIAPQDNAGVVAVTFDHPFQEAQVFLVDTHQSVLVDDEDTLPVTDIKQRRGHRVV